MNFNSKNEWNLRLFPYFCNMFIGRKEEKRRLINAYESEDSEFVAVYGRRRVGKTYLIRETLKNKFTFYHTGRYKIPTKRQIESFYLAMKEQGLKERRKPVSWMETFSLLKRLIESSTHKKKVIFLDELPWMDAAGSDFVSSLEFFWNSWASARKDVMLIICGSASSWILKKIFRNKGGLHNRVTCKIPLKPFSLYEVELLVKERKLGYSRNNILEGYMAMGGVPIYWCKLEKSKSLAENINDMFFLENGEFHNEYRELYDSLFLNAEKYKAIIEALATKRKGLTRSEIIKKAKLENNGRFSSMLEDLIECGFIRKYCDLGKRVKDAKYQLIDFFTLFYFHFIREAVNVDQNYWSMMQLQQRYKVWCGIAFEKVCMVHSRQIKKAMGISGIIANVFSWQNYTNDQYPKVQIDMIFERSDNLYSLFEMKYAPGGYRITRTEIDNILQRKNVFEALVKGKKGVQTVLVTSNGVSNSALASEINCILEANELFVE